MKLREREREGTIFLNQRNGGDILTCYRQHSSLLSRSFQQHICKTYNNSKLADQHGKVIVHDFLGLGATEQVYIESTTICALNFVLWDCHRQLWAVAAYLHGCRLKYKWDAAWTKKACAGLWFGIFSETNYIVDSIASSISMYSMQHTQWNTYVGIVNMRKEYFSF